jgi:linoleoyl-CoA desaturase
MTATAEQFDLTIDGSAAGTPRAPQTTQAPSTLNSRLSVTTAERRHVPKRSGKPDPAAHLSTEQIEALGAELDALRQEILDSRGARDAAYIRTVLKWQRGLEMGSRAVLLFSLFPPAWVAGTAGLSVAKILENMELGHNIMHGQWDWMRDPRIHSKEWEWDNASPAEFWKHSHNELHHTFTNVIGRDNDLGYGIMRVDEDQRWTPAFLGQPLWNFVNACFFEYGIAAYDLELGAYLKGRGKDRETFRRDAGKVVRKIGRQARKDYLIHPLLSGPSFFHTVAANFTANVVRNLWTHSVIMCGHFPEGVETFAKDSIEGETRGEWYLRQMIGSANISGSKAMHLMTGNLSHQIEHHLFPDLPSNRYFEIAPRVREICERYGLRYTTGPLPKQVASAWKQVVVLALPNPEPGRTRVGIAAEAVGKRVQRKLRRRARLARA